MTDYEAEHNLPPASTTTGSTAQSRRRPDLSTFYNSLREVEVPENGSSNVEPLPVNVEASFVLLAEALTDIQRDSGDENNSELLDGMLDFLRHQAADPPKKVEGVSQEFLDGLERVDKNRFGDGTCPICNEKFIDDPYPLVVKLPCHPEHKFDLECIQPWLKLNPTCPLDRKDLVTKKKLPPQPVEQEDEEDYDDYYA